jgi:assimilatory nitrate reductase catalytic subunit
MGTNPAVSLPDADAVRAALGTCPFVVVSDSERRTDTTELAHVLLPAAAWGEKDGTVTNSERRISRQRAFLPLPGEARPDWWILTQVAQRLGFAAAFPYRGPDAIFAEHARLSGLVAQDFDIAAAAGRDYATLDPFQWGGPQPFADGRFFTPDGRARFVPVTPQGPASTLSADLPLRLNTGRYRDQWHSMTRTGRSAKLARHRPEPCLDLHPEDAHRHGVTDGGLARVESPRGTALLRVRVSGEARPGLTFAPLHWNAQSAGNARVGTLIAPVVDPVSGQPELKATPVRVRPYRKSGTRSRAGSSVQPRMASGSSSATRAANSFAPP